MSLHVAAQHLASKGRDGDTELVHMTKGEIKGLQGLALAHGGSLSINPNTGLVEASFLKNLLPMIAGIGLNAMFPGSGALIGLGVGGFEAARTGDIGKGLMAGLGAYGGAGLGAGLTAAGASAGASNIAPGVVDAAGTAGLPQGVSSAVQGINPAAAPIVTGTTSAAPSTFMGNLSQAGQGIGELGGSAGRDAFMKAAPIGTLPAAGASLLSAIPSETPEMPGTPEEEERYKGSPYRYNLASNFAGSSPARPNPYYTPTGLGYAAQGGSTNDIMMAAGGSYDDEPMGDNSGMAAGGIAGYAAGGLKMKTMSPGEGTYHDTDTDTASLNAFDAAKKRMAKINKAANMPKNYETKMPQVRGLGELAMASGGLGGYSDGGRMLKGPGDGMSDSIPATIGKGQPARLADGEFVVPADVVSHLGNGSTDAGAKKLYSMMDKIRTARTGKKKQAPAVKTDKYMPA
jgi:hypothetical protein